MSPEHRPQARVKVLVLSDESLFELGVQNLLRQQEGLDIVSCVPDADIVRFHLQTFQPEVVILNSARPRGASEPEWIQILRDMPGVRLLGLSLQDSSICVYRGDTQPVREVADLIRAIQGVDA